MRLVLVPLAMLSTPQQLAVLVNSWSLMSTSSGSRPAATPQGRTVFLQPGLARVDFADLEGDVAAGLEDAVQFAEKRRSSPLARRRACWGTVSLTDVASMPRNQQRSQLSVA